MLPQRFAEPLWPSLSTMSRRGAQRALMRT